MKLPCGQCRREVIRGSEMLPVIHIFGFHVPMYSLMTFLGVVAYAVTYYCVIERGRKLDRVSSNRFIFVSILAIIALYISAYLLNSLYHSIEEGEIVFGGITWLGGIVGCIPAMLLGIHFLVPKAKGNAVELFSLVIPGLVLGHAFGRMGCFFGGCCFGGVTDGPFGVVFPAGSVAAQTYPGENGASLPLYPTQLFEACFEFLLFLFMVIFRKKFTKYNLGIYAVAYGVFRFLIEFLRGDDRGSLAGALSPSQWTSIVLVIFGVLLILFQKGYVFKKLGAKCEKWREIAKKTPVTVMGKKGVDHVAMLRELQQLRNDGIITEEEFKSKKAEILKRI